MMGVPVIIVGGGGHAKVLAEIVGKQAVIIGLTVQQHMQPCSHIENIPVLGDDSEILHYFVNEIMLVNGIGVARSTQKRKQIFEQFKNLGYHFVQVIHETAVISSTVKLSEGIQLMAGSIIQPYSQIGSNSIVNTKASVDHDCLIDEHVHIAPGATLCGGVKVGEGTLIGAGATVLQGIRIGSNCLIGAGSLITRDVPDGVCAIGVPAREVRE